MNVGCKGPRIFCNVKEKLSCTFSVANAFLFFCDMIQKLHGKIDNYYLLDGQGPYCDWMILRSYLFGGKGPKLSFIEGKFPCSTFLMAEAPEYFVI